MKFKKKDLKKLAEKYSSNPAKFYRKVSKMSLKSTPQMWVSLDDCDNLLNYNEGFFNMIIKHHKWDASILFIDGQLDIIEFIKK